MVINLNPILPNGCLACLDTGQVAILIADLIDGDFLKRSDGTIRTRTVWTPCRCESGRTSLLRRYADQAGPVTGHVDYPLDGAPA